MPRTLLEIEENIKALEESLRKCQEEKDEIKELCPHPGPFVSRKSEYDEYGRLDYTYSVYTCSLCTKSWKPEE